MPEIVKEQLSKQWWVEHKNRITGGTAPGCTGWCDEAPISAWKRIKQLKAPESNWYTEYGIRFEENARRAYMRETGIFVWPTGFWVHPEHDWLGSSPDGIGDGLLEAKCPQVLPTAIPLNHEIQMRVAMAVTGLPWCDYCAWTPAGTFIQRCTRDMAAEAALIWYLQWFYNSFIVTNTPPPRRKKVPPKEGFVWESLRDATTVMEISCVSAPSVKKRTAKKSAVAIPAASPTPTDEKKEQASIDPAGIAPN